jgi:hypothetical protein
VLDSTRRTESQPQSVTGQQVPIPMSPPFKAIQATGSQLSTSVCLTITISLASCQIPEDGFLAPATDTISSP